MNSFLRTLRELAVLTRLGNARLSRWQHLRDLERARTGIDRCFVAEDAARTELAMLEQERLGATGIPLYLKLRSLTPRERDYNEVQIRG